MKRRTHRLTDRQTHAESLMPLAPIGDRRIIKTGVKRFSSISGSRHSSIWLHNVKCSMFPELWATYWHEWPEIAMCYSETWKQQRANVFYAMNIFLFLGCVLITVLLCLHSRRSINRLTELKTATISLWEKRTLRLISLWTRPTVFGAKRLIGYSNGSVGDLLFGSIPGAGHLFRYATNQPPQANSAFHPSRVGKWVPASTGKAKAGMVHFVSGWTRGVQVKLWDPLRTRAITERLRGVFTTRRYTNSRLPYLTW